MIYYETLLFILVAVALLSFIAGFASRMFRYVFWFLSFVFMGLSVSTIVKHSRDMKQETKKFLGVYKIDADSSVYQAANVKLYRDLVLYVESDHSFYFNMDTSPFLSREGRWKLTDNEDGGYLHCYFRNKEINAYTSRDHATWTFRGDCLKEAAGGDVIYFRRVKEK